VQFLKYAAQPQAIACGCVLLHVNFRVILSGAAAGCAVEESVFSAAEGSAMKSIAGCGSFDSPSPSLRVAQDDMHL